jgi:phospholipid N-methyltransferase
MDYLPINELDIMSHAANYNNWIWKTIKRYVGKNIIEIGAGIGTFTKYLLAKEHVFATDIAQNCIEILHNQFHETSNITIEGFDITRIPDIALWRRRKIDTIICLNVLEHIKDDIKALNHMKAIVKPGANIIIMVPAFQFAYGTIDKLDGHHRRYSIDDIRTKLIKTNIEPINIHYFNSIGLLAWFYTGRVVKNVSTSPSKVKIYDKYFVPWISYLEGLINPPFGQSLIAVGRRP